MNPTPAYWFNLLGRLATEAALIVALAMVAQRFLAAPHLRRTLWQAVLLSLSLVWAAELGGARDWVARWRPEARQGRRLTAAIVGESPSTLAEPGLPPTGESAYTRPEGAPTPPIWWPLHVWLAGSLVFAMRAAALRLWLGLAAARRTCMSDATLLARVDRLRTRVGLRHVRMVAWPGLRSPIAFGTWRPSVALPVDFAGRFAPEAQDAMLAHELAHLAAGDPLWLGVADAALALSWWHPGAWWARAQLRAASEAAADEASALVPGGRVALAESLVALGRELASPGWARGLGVAGGGLKSQLARRVTALLRTSGEWHAARPAWLWLSRFATVAVAGTLATLRVPGAGGPSLPTLLAAARVDEVTVVESQPGKPASSSLGPATQGGSGSNAADGRPIPTTGAAPAAKPMNSGAARIQAKLDAIVLPEIRFNSVTLGEAVRQLEELALQQDPEKRGVNIILNPPVGDARTATDPATEQLPLRQPDLSQRVVHLNPSLHGVRLRDALDAVAKAAEPPVAWSVEDYAVVLHQPVREPLHTRQYRLSAAAFHDEVARFLPPGDTNVQVGVRSFFATNGVAFGPLSRGGAKGQEASGPAEDVKAVFLNDRTGRLFVRATDGELELVEHALQRLNLPPPESSATETPQQGPAASPNPRQVELAVQFVEITEAGRDDMGLDWLFGQSPTNNPALQSGPATNLLTGAGAPHGRNLRVDLLSSEGQSATLTTAQFGALQSRLKARSGVEILAAPKLVTPAGRQAHIEVSDIRGVVTGAEATPATATNRPGIRYETEPIATGPAVDLLAHPEKDGWRLTIQANVTSFLGYDEPRPDQKLAPAQQGEKPLKGVVPLPRLRVQKVQAECSARRGETVALRGPLVDEIVRYKDKVPVLGDIPLLGRPFRKEGTTIQHKRLYVFVTPMEITPAGEAK